MSGDEDEDDVVGLVVGVDVGVVVGEVGEVGEVGGDVGYGNAAMNVNAGLS